MDAVVERKRQHPCYGHSLAADTARITLFPVWAVDAHVGDTGSGSVVITSRMGVAMSANSRWRAFAISHTGGQTWDKAWTFPADQPFDVGYVLHLHWIPVGICRAVCARRLLAVHEPRWCDLLRQFVGSARGTTASTV